MKHRNFAALGLVVLTLLGCASTTERKQQQQPAMAYNGWLEINTANFEHNVRAIAVRTGGVDKICAVMKADAYGHGITALMPAVLRSTLSCVAVASNSDIEQVRAGGFKGRLLRIRAATLAELAGAVPHQVEELVGNLSYARQLSKLAVERNVVIKVHLMIDAGGMSRNGLVMDGDSNRQQAAEIARLPGLAVVGLMTHFPVDDRNDALRVLNQFKAHAQWLMQAANLDKRQVIWHAANSYATINVPEAILDMARPGALLYGDTPLMTEFKKVMAVKSRVVALDEYPQAATVGYDRTYTLKRQSQLATIPLGYSDGYGRVFSNKSHVLIRGHKVPVLGRVSMNMLVVDVTEVPGVALDDEVVLFGKQDAVEVTQAELEQAAGTLFTEVGLNLGRALPRIAVP
jgi:alanine racemase